MSLRYNVHHQGKDLGPLSIDEIERKFKLNQLYPTDFIYMSDRSDWVPITEFLMEQTRSNFETMVYPNPPQPPPAPAGHRVAKAIARPTTKPMTPPPRFRKSKSIDASAVAQINVLPERATRLHLEILGEARVGDDLEVCVHALSEAGVIDRSFSDVVHLGCDRPLASLEPLVFKGGIAKIKVQCLTPGPHQFFLSLEPIREKEKGIEH